MNILLIACIALALAILADYGLTQRNLSEGGREGNDLMAGAKTRLVISAGCFVLAGILYWAAAPWPIPAGLALWRAYGAWTNWQAIQRRKARRG